MKGSEFVFDYVDLLYYSLHKISLNRGGSYIDSLDWMKNKKAAVALNYNEISNSPQKISKIKPFINNHNWKDIEFHHTQRIGKNLNKTIKQLLVISYLYRIILNK